MNHKQASNRIQRVWAFLTRHCFGSDLILPSLRADGVRTPMKHQANTKQAWLRLYSIELPPAGRASYFILPSLRAVNMYDDDETPALLHFRGSGSQGRRGPKQPEAPLAEQPFSP